MAPQSCNEMRLAACKTWLTAVITNASRYTVTQRGQCAKEQRQADMLMPAHVGSKRFASHTWFARRLQGQAPPSSSMTSGSSHPVSLLVSDI